MIKIKQAEMCQFFRHPVEDSNQDQLQDALEIGADEIKITKPELVMEGNYVFTYSHNTHGTNPVSQILIKRMHSLKLVHF